MKEKKCTCCKQVKPVEQFYKNPAMKSGYNSFCKECQLMKTNISKSKNNNTTWSAAGFSSEEEHFNACLEQLAQVFDMPQLLKHRTYKNKYNNEP